MPYYVLNTTPPTPNNRRGITVVIGSRRVLPGQRLPFSDEEAQEAILKLRELSAAGLVSLRDARTGDPVDPRKLPDPPVPEEPPAPPVEVLPVAPAPAAEGEGHTFPIDPDRTPSVREILAYRGPIPTLKKADVVPLRGTGTGQR